MAGAVAPANRLRRPARLFVSERRPTPGRMDHHVFHGRDATDTTRALQDSDANKNKSEAGAGLDHRMSLTVHAWMQLSATAAGISSVGFRP